MSDREAELFRQLSNQEKFNIASRHSLCEQNDRLTAERDELQQRINRLPSEERALNAVAAIIEQDDRAGAAYQDTAYAILSSLVRELTG